MQGVHGHHTALRQCPPKAYGLQSPIRSVGDTFARCTCIGPHGRLAGAGHAHGPPLPPTPWAPGAGQPLAVARAPPCNDECVNEHCRLLQCCPPTRGGGATPSSVVRVRAPVVPRTGPPWCRAVPCSRPLARLLGLSRQGGRARPRAVGHPRRDVSLRHFNSRSSYFELACSSFYYDMCNRWDRLELRIWRGFGRSA